MKTGKIHFSNGSILAVYIIANFPDCDIVAQDKIGNRFVFNKFGKSKSGKSSNLIAD